MAARPLQPIIAFCLYLALAHAHAAPIFKSTMPDGEVIYGPAEVRGAKKVEKLIPNTTDSGIKLSTPEQKQSLDQRKAQEHDADFRHQTQIDQLKAALQSAEAQREAGREPHDGDFIGNARGGMRLNEEYWERQKQLEQAVVDARKRLEEAQTRAH
jgi:hypothetical protein